MSKSKLLLLVVVIAVIAVFFLFDLGRFFNLHAFKEHQAAIEDYYQHHFWLTVTVFFAVYVAVTALSLPGAAVMTIVAGTVFGLVTGTVIVSFASSVGASLAFLAARFILRDTIQNKFGDKLAAVNAGVEKDGAFYLFSLRLVPLFPFFVINLLMALTPIRTLTFYWVSQVGMFAGTVVYVNAGTQIAQIDSLQGILSVQLLVSFVLLGIFPLLARLLIGFIKQRRGTKPSMEYPKS